MPLENDRLFDLRTLEAFQAAMSSGSMTGAARMLGLGQPTVTRMVRDLEVAVGFQLFHRNGPRISPTERGMRFFEEVQRLTIAMRQIRARARAIRDESPPAFDLAATLTMSGGLVGPALEAMEDRLPAQVNVQAMRAEHVVRALRNRTADFGMSGFPFDHAGLRRHVIAESRMVAAVPEGGPLDRPGPLSMAEVAGVRLVTVGSAFRTRRALDRALDAAGVAVGAEISTNSSLNAVMAARAGLGAAIVDPVTAYGIPVAGIAIRPLEVAIPFLCGLFAAADRSTPPGLVGFVAGFRTACARVIPDCVFHDPDDADLMRALAELATT